MSSTTEWWQERCRDLEQLRDHLQAERDALYNQLKSTGCVPYLDRIRDKQAIIDRLPRRDDALLALRALNYGCGFDFRKELCGCDPDVGCSPCEYCAIYTVLQRVAEAAEAAERNE